MGADIHIYAERKLKTGPWAMAREFTGIDLRSFHVGPVKLTSNCLRPNVSGRNYNFFAALAGVRGVGPEPRGLPDDISPLVAEEADSWDGDGHSHSWMSARDFIPIFIAHKMSEENVLKIARDRIDGISSEKLLSEVCSDYIGVNIPSKWTDKGEIIYLDDIRFVFWFDN